MELGEEKVPLSPLRELIVLKPVPISVHGRNLQSVCSDYKLFNTDTQVKHDPRVRQW